MGMSVMARNGDVFLANIGYWGLLNTLMRTLDLITEDQWSAMIGNDGNGLDDRQARNAALGLESFIEAGLEEFVAVHREVFGSATAEQVGNLLEDFISFARDSGGFAVW